MLPEKQKYKVATLIRNVVSAKTTFVTEPNTPLSATGTVANFVQPVEN